MAPVVSVVNFSASLFVIFSYIPPFMENTGEATLSSYVAVATSLHVLLVYDAAFMVVLVPNSLMDMAVLYFVLFVVGVVPSSV